MSNGLFPKLSNAIDFSGLGQRLSYFGAHECARLNGRRAWNRPAVVSPTRHSSTCMIERQLAFDFYDPSLEWRRLFAETWGTFLLVLVAAGGGVVAAMSGGRVTLGMIVVAPGIMVMAIIYFMGAVSGAHLNPAVTLAFALRRDFPWKRVPGYMLAHLRIQDGRKITAGSTPA